MLVYLLLYWVQKWGCASSCRRIISSSNTYQLQLMPKSKTRRKVRQSQRVKTLREYVVVESIFLSMQMATKFDQTNKIKKLPKNKRNRKNNLAKNFLFRDAYFRPYLSVFEIFNDPSGYFNIFVRFL